MDQNLEPNNDEENSILDDDDYIEKQKRAQQIDHLKWFVKNVIVPIIIALITVQAITVIVQNTITQINQFNTSTQQIISTPSLTMVPTEIPTLLPTASPTTIDFLEIAGDAGAAQNNGTETGTVYVCPTSGTYILKIMDGAYTTWPNGIGQYNGQWRTYLLVYVNKDIDQIWGRTEIGSPEGTNFVQPIRRDINDLSLGFLEDRINGSKDQAENDGRGQIAILHCETSWKLLFMPFDEKGYYSDNEGTVSLSIERPDR
jgi:hypothetical protein